MKKIHSLMEDNLVPLIIFIFLLVTIPLSKLSPSYLIQEIILRLDRNLFLVLSLLVPIIAGMGLNFGIVLGAMGGQIALIFISEWRIVGIEGIIRAFILSTPLSILLGWLSGEILKSQGKRNDYLYDFRIIYEWSLSTSSFIWYGKYYKN